jgi:hypothetical protein
MPFRLASPPAPMLASGWTRGDYLALAIAIFTGLTVVILGVQAGIQLIAHLHDRALSGTSQPVLARSVPSGPFIDFPVNRVQGERTSERLERIRGVHVSLLNRADMPTRVELLSARCWFGPRIVEAAAYSWMPQGRASGMWSITLEAKRGWRRTPKHKWMTVVMENEVGVFRFRGRLRLFRLVNY